MPFSGASNALGAGHAMARPYKSLSRKSKRLKKFENNKIKKNIS